MKTFFGTLILLYATAAPAGGATLSLSNETVVMMRSHSAQWRRTERAWFKWNAWRYDRSVEAPAAPRRVRLAKAAPVARRRILLHAERSAPRFDKKAFLAKVRAFRARQAAAEQASVSAKKARLLSKDDFLKVVRAHRAEKEVREGTGGGR